MPRISAEARATQTASAAGKLKPSPHLSTDERKVWKTLVDSTPAGHLSERDRPLVETFVCLTVVQRKVAKQVAEGSATELVTVLDASVKRVESIAKTLAALSNRLKLAPLASHSAPHKAGQRAEQPEKPAPLLGGLARVK